MDSNHDIVPTLRMMDGVYTGLAADEIERLRARVALLERRADTSLIPGAEPTHRCNVCGAYWRKWDIGGQTSWNLNSRGCGECCDNVAMGDQIEALASPAKVGGDDLLPSLSCIQRMMQTLTKCGVSYGEGGAEAFYARLESNIYALCSAIDRAYEAKVGGDEREAFEAYARTQRFPLARVEIAGVSAYEFEPVEKFWQGWQARAALSADGGEDKRQFPMRNGPSIPWALAEVVYAGYSALYGTHQSLTRLGERGGFGWDEVPGIYSKHLGREAIDAAIATKAKGDAS